VTPKFPNMKENALIKLNIPNEEPKVKPNILDLNYSKSPQSP
jgi:hypothetical protein